MASGSGSSPLVETRERYERFGQLLAKTVARRTVPRRLQVKAVTKQRKRPAHALVQPLEEDSPAKRTAEWRRRSHPAGVWVGGDPTEKWGGRRGGR